jgi:hypothetical protein
LQLRPVWHHDIDARIRVGLVVELGGRVEIQIVVEGSAKTKIVLNEVAIGVTVF